MRSAKVRRTGIRRSGYRLGKTLRTLSLQVNRVSMSRALQVPGAGGISTATVAEERARTKFGVRQCESWRNPGWSDNSTEKCPQTYRLSDSRFVTDRAAHFCPLRLLLQLWNEIEAEQWASTIPEGVARCRRGPIGRARTRPLRRASKTKLAYGGAPLNRPTMLLSFIVTVHSLGAQRSERLIEIN